LAIQPSAFPKPRAYVNNCAFSLEYQYRFKDENIDHCFVCRETCLKYLCRLSSDRYNEMSLQVVLQIDIIIFCTAMVFIILKKKKKKKKKKKRFTSKGSKMKSNHSPMNCCNFTNHIKGEEHG
jgi:hypothetical protein